MQHCRQNSNTSTEYNKSYNTKYFGWHYIQIQLNTGHRNSNTREYILSSVHSLLASESLLQLHQWDIIIKCLNLSGEHRCHSFLWNSGAVLTSMHNCLYLYWAPESTLKRLLNNLCISLDQLTLELWLIKNFVIIRIVAWLRRYCLPVVFTVRIFTRIICLYLLILYIAHSWWTYSSDDVSVILFLFYLYTFL